jgi:hypothetical protein
MVTAVMAAGSRDVFQIITGILIAMTMAIVTGVTGTLIAMTMVIVTGTLITMAMEIGAMTMVLKGNSQQGVGLITYGNSGPHTHSQSSTWQGQTSRTKRGHTRREV